MKTKIISFGILLCVITACGVTNSKRSQKFNPHSLDGLYSFVYETHVLTPDSLLPFPPSSCAWPTDNGKGCLVQRFYTNYMYVNYPHLHACAAIGQDPTFFEPIGKENVKVAHKKGNLYTVKKMNSNIVNSNNVTYIITGGASHVDGDTTYYLGFNKIKDGNEYYGSSFKNSGYFDLNKGYQKCRSKAPDTTGIFPSTQKYAVKPK